MLLRKLALLLLFPLPAYAAVADVQSAKALPSATSGTLAFGSNVTAGNLLSVSFTAFSSASIATPTDSRSTSYTLLERLPGSGTSFIYYFVGIAPSSGADTVSFSGLNANNVLVVIAERSGVAGVYLAGFNTSTTGTSWALPNALAPLTAQGGMMVSVGVQVSLGSDTFGLTGGTILQQGSPSGGLTGVEGDQAVAQQTTFATFTATLTLTSSASGSQLLIFLEPVAPSGGGAANSAYAP